jgi:hypothetical protein
VEAVDENTYRRTGDLTIKGITRPVTVDFQYIGTARDAFGNTRLGFEGTTTINRKDWGVEWNAALETGGVLVSEKIILELEISAIKAEQDWLRLRPRSYGSTLTRGRTTVGERPGDTDPQIGPAW